MPRKNLIKILLYSCLLSFVLADSCLYPDREDNTYNEGDTVIVAYDTTSPETDLWFNGLEEEDPSVPGQLLQENPFLKTVAHVLNNATGGPYNYAIHAKSGGDRDVAHCPNFFIGQGTGAPKTYGLDYILEPTSTSSAISGTLTNTVPTTLVTSTTPTTTSFNPSTTASPSAALKAATTSVAPRLLAR
ncbi:MAG: hypothetical protein M1820_009239 [Bogoriella megaspora]|nr:MAG: hypothetical protein M1820_009239 [Bogoriella megaspora]